MGVRRMRALIQGLPAESLVWQQAEPEWNGRSPRFEPATRREPEKFDPEAAAAFAEQYGGRIVYDKVGGD